MRRVLSTETRIVVVFATAVIVLAVVAGMSVRLTMWLLDDLYAVPHRVDVLDAVGDATTSMTSTASAARAYASLRMESDFAEYEKQRDELQRKLSRLEELTRENSQQNVRVMEVLSIFRDKVDATTRETERGALEFTWQPNAINALTLQMRDIAPAERDLLRQRNAEATASALWAGSAIVAASVLATVLVTGALVRIMRDLRIRRRAAEELERARMAAESASIAKSAFLANMSHELRTPLTSILGYADLLLEPEISAKKRQDYLQTMRRSGEHLLTLINDILDVSKIEAGRMAAENIECRMIEIFGDVESLMHARAKEKGLEFAVAFETPIPERVRTDPTRVRQILMNLAGNAIKFTDAGSVRVVVRCEAAEGGVPRVVRLIVDVIDTGMGISPEQQSQLFQPFMQADVSTTRRFGGTGLGLSISRRLSRILGGNLTVQSEQGRGSRFRLEVPVRELVATAWATPGENWHQETRAGRVKVPVRRQLGMHVLLAEDGMENREVLMLHLQHAGCDVDWAPDGEKACKLAQTSMQAGGRAYDVVLMDMQMPVMDGYTATAKLRAEGYNGTIIALTAHALKEDRDRCLEVGCDEYFSKPVDIPALFEMMIRFSGRMGEGTVRERVHENLALRKLSWKFCESTVETMRTMRKNVQVGKMEEVAVAAHKLAGAGGAYGFNEITQEAKGLERLVQGKSPLEQIEMQLTRLENVCRSAGSQLESLTNG